MFAQPTCSACNTPIERSAKFCPHCGVAQQGAQRTCRQCNRPMDATAKFCPHCGAAAGQSAAADVRRNRWQRNAGEIAVRLEARDLKGWLFKDLIIEPGEQALLILDGRTAANQRADGRMSEVIGPGSYVIHDLGDRLATAVGLRNVDRASVILMEEAPFDVEFNLEGMFTQDPLRVALSVRASMAIRDPRKLYTGLLRTRMRLTAADLADHLRDEAFMAASEWIRRQTMQELTVDADARDLLEIALVSALDHTLEDVGVEFRHLRTFNYVSPVLDQELRTREEYLIRRTELDTKLREERLLSELKSVEELQKLAEETRAVEQYERRAELRGRMRRAVMSDKFAELRDQREMEGFLRGMDREKLLSDDEWERFQRTVAWRRDDELRNREDALRDRDWARQISLEDRDRDRAHLLARIDLENRYDLQRLQAEQEFAQAKADLTRRVELEPAQLEHELATARQRLEGQFALDVIELEADLELKQRKEQFEIAQREAEATARRKQELEDALNALKIRNIDKQIGDIGRDEDRADVELGVYALNLMQRNKAEIKRLQLEIEREDIKLRKEIDRVDERERAVIEFERTKQIQQLAIDKERLAQEYAIKRLEAVRGATTEELIATTDNAEIADRLLQLKRDEHQRFQGMSDKEIAASLSPSEYVKFLLAKEQTDLARLSDSEKEQWINRLLDEREKRVAAAEQEAQRQREDRKDDSARSEREDERRHERDLRHIDRSADAEIARAQQQPSGQTPPTVIITGAGSGGATTIGGGAAAQSGAPTLRCPKCSQVVEETANFCPNCQHRLRGS